MSYSDYGSYNWKKEKGNWIFKPEFEDTSFISQIVGGAPSKELIEVIDGLPLKIHAVKASMDMEEQFPDLPFAVRNTHHSVIGDLKNYAVVSYKGHPTVLKAGKIVDGIDYDDVEEYDWIEGKEVKKKNFTPKTINIVDGNCVVKVSIDNSENFWSVAYVKNNEDEYLSMCGYGLGDGHFWLDENGKEVHDGVEDSDTMETFDIDMNPIANDHYRWPREKQCLDRAVKFLNL
jgi:hypothetical protein